LHGRLEAAHLDQGRRVDGGHRMVVTQRSHAGWWRTDFCTEFSPDLRILYVGILFG
jgi:hypothetical protein